MRGPDQRGMVRGKKEERGVKMRGERGETENNDDDNNRKCGNRSIRYTDGRRIATTHTMESILGLTKYNLILFARKFDTRCSLKLMWGAETVLHRTWVRVRDPRHQGGLSAVGHRETKGSKVRGPRCRSQDKNQDKNLPRPAYRPGEVLDSRQ